MLAVVTDDPAAENVKEMGRVLKKYLTIPYAETVFEPFQRSENPDFHVLNDANANYHRVEERGQFGENRYKHYMVLVSGSNYQSKRYHNKVVLYFDDELAVGENFEDALQIALKKSKFALIKNMWKKSLHNSRFLP